MMNRDGYHILVVDDETNIRRMLTDVLQDESYRVTTAGDTTEAAAVLADDPPDLILLDVQLPGEDGLGWLRRLREADEQTPVVMMSGHGTIDTAMTAVKSGAMDFIEKPLQPERLLLSIANGLDMLRLRHENSRLLEADGGGGDIIGGSAGIKAVLHEIELTAPTDARVLITGENGTGKELVAKALHTGSARANRPYIKVNCAAIPSELLESELFGHERGAFTGAVSARRGKFELAQRGTLLLDEIGDMNPTTQAKLLRVLEEGEMERVGGERVIKLDVRIFASTNQDLPQRIADGDFREDLYHRLKVVPIHVPPLRERSDDVPGLCAHYLDHFHRATGRGPVTLAPEALQALAAYRWPGNVRELRNLMERLVIMIAGPIGLQDIRPFLGESVGPAGAESCGSLADILEDTERRTIQGALERSTGNVAAAARELGVDRANLSRKMGRLGLE
jgi:two-component system, NtrC family, nitrogen regulation response regulator NtrX